MGGVRLLSPTRLAVPRYLLQHAGRLLTQNDLPEAACPKAYVEATGEARINPKNLSCKRLISTWVDGA